MDLSDRVVKVPYRFIGPPVQGADQGLRSAVTGGAQMDGFISLLTEIIVESGAEDNKL